MKTAFAVFWVVFFVQMNASYSATGTETATNGCSPATQELSAKKLKELQSLPVGIGVIHQPVTVVPVWNSVANWQYKWEFSTSVIPLKESIKVQEFGSFTWSGSRWYFSDFTGSPFTSKDFASWYSCPGAKLNVGSLATDPDNWSASSFLAEGKTLWYFIGTNEKGVRVKGEAVVILSGELKGN